MDLNATSITEVILLYPKLKISKHIIDLIICFGEAPFIQHWFACNSDESTPKGDQCLRDLFRCYGLRLVFEWWYLFSSVKARFTHQVVLATEVYLLVWLTVKTWNHYIRARDPEISDHQAQPTDNVGWGCFTSNTRICRGRDFARPCNVWVLEATNVAIPPFTYTRDCTFSQESSTLACILSLQHSLFPTIIHELSPFI